MRIEDLQARLEEFARERDWERFHVPEQLASALSIEASELMELFLWKDRAQVDELLESEDGRRRVCQEAADVFIYLVRFCDVTGIDLMEAAREKMVANREKYPVDEVVGEACQGRFTKR